MPLVSLEQISIAYGHLPLIARASLQIETGERVAVIGRNGAGKSTLLRIIEGSLPPDSGGVWQARGARLARLEQDVPLSTNRRVFDAVHDGLARHTDEEDWEREQRVRLVLSRLNLDGEAVVDALSGGWKRRVLLARALVGQPDVLLLDEPTNHLDIDAILWLEEFLRAYRGAVVFVTHDREFLERLATRIVEIDRGQLTSWPGDYAAFLRRKDEALDNEVQSDEKFDRKLAEEEAWIRRGVKARRTRDEGRVRALMAMREQRAVRRAQMGAVRLQFEAADPTGKVVFETEGIAKSYDDSAVVRDFSTRVMRGDRIGFIGPNGAGKTTLLRMLIGELPPDGGEVRHGANVQIAYYDQQREQLDPERTVVDTVGDGNDMVTVNGHSRHVMGYLQDFLFAPERARSPVKALSGGERNRLLLARMLTRPANVLVLDEPTNDLDLETLELLEEQLLEWSGTLLLVSHDRRFLDNVVTSTIAFEGQGRWLEYVGGYHDWLRQRGSTVQGFAVHGPEGHDSPVRASAAPASPAPAPPAAAKRKLSYKDQRELEALPATIAALEEEQKTLEARAAAPEFYKEGADAIRGVLERIEAVGNDLHVAYERWVELEAMASQ
ncbi:MAG TPA: ATP-binding cassette domain-containing protein [Vicinamibacterales bacterium]|nr:ATP-binding cassette domain-containing protein [Vicinamibacterales bacterium]